MRFTIKKLKWKEQPMTPRARPKIKVLQDTGLLTQLEIEEKFSFLPTFILLNFWLSHPKSLVFTINLPINWMKEII